MSILFFWVVWGLLKILAMKGVTGSLQRAFKKHHISLYFKAGYTVRIAVVSPKHLLDLREQCAVIYVIM